MGPTASGHAYKQSKLQVKRLHIAMSRSTSHSDRCAELPVAGRINIRVPTGMHHTTVYSTVKGGEAIQYPISGTMEPSSEVVSDLIRSFKREWPIPAKHVVEWDIQLVLEFFKSGRFQHWDQLSDRDLTLKTVFLLALVTGKRRSEIHALSQEVRWINGDVRTVEISPVPSFMSKTHVITNGLGALRQITLNSLEEGGEENGDHLLCRVCTLESYMKRSTKYRSPEQNRLIISYRRGTTRDISRQTISAWS